MSTEKMNSEFEVWRKEQIASLMRTGYPETAKAFRDLGSIHWMAWQSSWQASRAAIEVDLTEVRKTTALPDRTWLLGNDVVSAIESIGLKVKS